MSEQEDVQPNAHLNARDAHTHFFKLPDFWPATPLAWFGIVESQFRIRGVTSEEDKFTLVASVLPETSARRVTHLLSAPPADCYTQLKASLLSSHRLTDIQRSELLFNMDDLGSKRPMELLTEMLELVKPGEEKTQLFAMLFMRRLPAQVRVQLTEDDHTDLRALAEKADRCAATLARKAAPAVISAVTSNVEDGEEPTTATISAVSSTNQRGNGGGNKKTGFWQKKKQFNKQRQDGDTPADVARLASGLCYPHFRFGAKAHSCSPPCNWQGN